MLRTIWQEAEHSKKNGNYKNAETKYTKLIDELEKGGVVSETRYYKNHSKNTFCKCRLLYTSFYHHVSVLNKNLILYNYNSSRSEQLALAYNNRGHAKYKLVCFDAAIEDYNRSIYYQPNLAIAYYNRATVFYRMGDFQLAAADLQQTLHLDPSFSEANVALSKTLKVIRTD